MLPLFLAAHTFHCVRNPQPARCLSSMAQLDANPQNHTAQLRMAVAHLEQQNPKFTPLFEKFGLPKVSVSKNLFLNLIKSIVYQQLAGAAAHKIFSRFLALFHPSAITNASGSDAFTAFFPDETKFLSPSAVAEMDVQRLRDVGLSARKVEYIQGLAEAVSSGKLDLDGLRGEPDDVVTQQVTGVRGLGPWTADMFKMVRAPELRSRPARVLLLTPFAARMRAAFRGPASKRPCAEARLLLQRMLCGAVLASAFRASVKPQTRIETVRTVRRYGREVPACVSAWCARACVRACLCRRGVVHAVCV